MAYETETLYDSFIGTLLFSSRFQKVEYSENGFEDKAQGFKGSFTWAQTMGAAS